MITKRRFSKRVRDKRYRAITVWRTVRVEGYYLFGFIPLCVVEIELW